MTRNTKRWITTIHDATLQAGLKLGGPQAWRNREGFTFFQGPRRDQLDQIGSAHIAGRRAGGCRADRGDAASVAARPRLAQVIWISSSPRLPQRRTVGWCPARG